MGCEPDSIHIDTKDQLEAMNKQLKGFESQEAKVFVHLRSSRLGLVRINTEELEALLRPSPGLCLADLHSALPLVYRRTCDALSDEMTSTLTTISVAVNVRQHVDLLKALKRSIRADKKKLRHNSKS